MALSAGAVGADIGRLTDLSKTYGNQATALAELIKTLDGETERSKEFWAGKFAQDFQENWATKAKPAFQQFVDALHTASVDLKQTAENIANATGAGSR